MARFADWRGVLRRQPAQARQVLNKLLAGPLRFTPRGSFYEFEGEASFAKILASIGFPISVASPPGLVHRRGWRPNSIHRPPGVEASSVEFLNSAANVR